MAARARFPDIDGEQDVAIKVISKVAVAHSLRRHTEPAEWTTMVATAGTITSEMEILRAFHSDWESGTTRHSPFFTLLLATFRGEINLYLVMVRHIHLPSPINVFMRL